MCAALVMGGGRRRAERVSARHVVHHWLGLRPDLRFRWTHELGRPDLPVQPTGVQYTKDQYVSSNVCLIRPNFSLKSSRSKLEEVTTKEHSSVICKLTRLCKLAPLVDEIKRMSVVMRQVQLEGVHLANLHVLRCLQDGEDLPELDQGLYYRCCAATLKNNEVRDRYSATHKYPSFQRTCQRYWSGREHVPTYAEENVFYGGDMMNEMARMMRVNSLNMVALQFRRRLHQYIRFRYAPEGALELKREDTKRLVDSCYRAKSVPELNKDGSPTGKMVKLWSEWEVSTDPVELELRAWLGMVPWQWTIRENCAHFVHKLHAMLVWIEEFVTRHPKAKGAKLYSLLPVSTSFQAIYVTINASTLYGLFRRLHHLPKVEEYLENELKIIPKKKKPTGSQLPFTLRTFQINRSKILRKVFDVAQFETKARKFVDEVKTNGYAASVTMIRPLTTTSVVVVEKLSPRKKRKINDGTAQYTTKKPSNGTPSEELADKDEFAKELFKLGPGYAPEVHIGIDPGMRSLVTAVTEGQLPQRSRRQRTQEHTRQPPPTPCPPTPYPTTPCSTTCRQHKRQAQPIHAITEISTREYRHLSKVNEFQFWNENLKKKEPWYAAVIRSMPSFKTSSYGLYYQHLQFFWMHLRFLLVFSDESAFLRWRFTRDRAKMVALDALAKRIVPVPTPQVCIAYGDWSRRDGLKGHATGPVKGFVKTLKTRATVLPMDEFRTSQLCSCCHKRLRQARLLTKVRRKKDEVDVRLKENPSKKELKEIEEMSRWKKTLLKDFKAVLRCDRNVLRCTNSGCKAQFWNRDVNAARNMLYLLKRGLQGEHGPRRPLPFRRSK